MRHLENLCLLLERKKDLTQNSILSHATVPLILRNKIEPVYASSLQ